MTHEDQSTRFEELLQLLSEQGFDGMAEAIEILMNEAMKLERANASAQCRINAQSRGTAGRLLSVLLRAKDPPKFELRTPASVYRSEAHEATS